MSFLYLPLVYYRKHNSSPIKTEQIVEKFLESYL